MELAIPDGARVTIAIGPEPAALPETFAIGHPPAGPRHLLLKGAVVGVLVLGAFIAGQRLGGRGGAQFASPRRASRPAPSCLSRPSTPFPPPCPALPRRLAVLRPSRCRRNSPGRCINRRSWCRLPAKRRRRHRARIRSGWRTER